MKVPIFFHALINQKWFLFFLKQSFPLNKANTASSKLGTFVTQISHLSIVSNDRCKIYTKDKSQKKEIHFPSIQNSL